MAEEGLEKTANDLIFVGHPIDFDSDAFLKDIDKLAEAAYSNSRDIRNMVMDFVPTYVMEIDLDKNKKALENFVAQ